MKTTPSSVANNSAMVLQVSVLETTLDELKKKTCNLSRMVTPAREKYAGHVENMNETLQNHAVVIDNIGRDIKRSLGDIVQLHAEGKEMNTKKAEMVDASMIKVSETIETFQKSENSGTEHLNNELREAREELEQRIMRLL